MNKWVQLIWGGGYSDERDDITGLSEKDVHLLQQSWIIVNKNKISIGTTLFIRLFEDYPDSKPFFTSFASVPNDELKGNVHLKAHVINFMNGFGMVISELKTPDVAIAICNKLGSTHGPRNVTRAHFNAAKQVLVKMLIEDLKLDEATLGSWQRFLVFMYDNIFSKLQK